MLLSPGQGLSSPPGQGQLSTSVSPGPGAFSPPGLGLTGWGGIRSPGLRSSPGHDIGLGPGAEALWRTARVNRRRAEQFILTRQTLAVTVAEDTTAECER